MKELLVLCFLAVTSLCLADHSETCPSERQAIFVEENLSRQCAEALRRLRFRSPPPLGDTTPFNRTMPAESDLNIACQESCSGDYSKWLQDVCKDPLTARSVDAICAATMETTAVGSTCRYAFPDAFNVRGLVMRVLAVCNFTQFDGDCSAEGTVSADLSAICPAFKGVTDALGCCYQSLYNDTSFISFFEAEGPINEIMAMNLLSFGQSPLWNRCGIDVPNRCEAFSSHAKPATPSILLVLVTITLFFMFK